jgi:hypothetical protein
VKDATLLLEAEGPNKKARKAIIGDLQRTMNGKSEADAINHLLRRHRNEQHDLVEQSGSSTEHSDHDDGLAVFTQHHLSHVNR